MLVFLRIDPKKKKSFRDFVPKSIVIVRKRIVDSLNSDNSLFQVSEIVFSLFSLPTAPRLFEGSK